MNQFAVDHKFINQFPQSIPKKERKNNRFIINSKLLTSIETIAEAKKKEEEIKLKKEKRKKTKEIYLEDIKEKDEEIEEQLLENDDSKTVYLKDKKK